MLTRTKLRALRQADWNGPNKLRCAAKLAGFTQVEIAAKLALPQSQVSKDMTGNALAVSLKKARIYADLFGCTVDDIFPQVSA